MPDFTSRSTLVTLEALEKCGIRQKISSDFHRNSPRKPLVLAMGRMSIYISGLRAAITRKLSGATVDASSIRRAFGVIGMSTSKSQSG